jgi:hypothetical protein
MIITIVFFEKNANCFAENWQKSQQFVIERRYVEAVQHYNVGTGLPDGTLSNQKSLFG